MCGERRRHSPHMRKINALTVIAFGGNHTAANGRALDLQAWPIDRAPDLPAATLPHAMNDQISATSVSTRGRLARLPAMLTVLSRSRPGALTPIDQFIGPQTARPDPCFDLPDRSRNASSFAARSCSPSSTSRSPSRMTSPAVAYRLLAIGSWMKFSSACRR